MGSATSPAGNPPPTILSLQIICHKFANIIQKTTLTLEESHKALNFIYILKVRYQLPLYFTYKQSMNTTKQIYEQHLIAKMGYN